MSMSKQVVNQRVKPVVTYVPAKGGQIEVGLPASVIALNHPSHLIYFGDLVRTSTVISIDEATGTFETRNSIYQLLKD